MPGSNNIIAESSCGGSQDCGKFDCTTHRPMKPNVVEALDTIEGQLYAINARNISMGWIGMRHTPTMAEISELNALLGFIIHEIRTLKEKGKLDVQALHTEHFK